jgi:alpha-glucosidase/alpha-D-xyloside xylohydrolase
VSGRNGSANPDPSELHDARVEPICRTFLELRARLMPYLYSAVREAHDSGLPIVRALWLHYPDDAAAVVRGDEYLWGRDMLVAPVVDAGATSRRLFLPRGGWHDFWTEERIQGGREVERAVELVTMPLYVRDGAIIPFGPVEEYTREHTGAPLTVVVYPGADGRFSLYEDDGSTFEHRRGAWMGIELEWKDAQRTLSLRLANGSRVLATGGRRMIVRVAPDHATHELTFDGRPLELPL